MLTKSDILFTGYYGHKNTGDDAFIEVTAWGAKKYWDKTNNRFLATKSSLPNTITSIKGYPFELRRSYRFQNSLLLYNTNAFVYSGGSTIHSKLSQSSIRYKAIKRKEQYKNIRLGAIGVSIGPFKSSNDEKAVQHYLKQMDFLALRDEASYNYAKSIDLPFEPVNAFDLAALLPNVYDYDFKKTKNEVKTIGISVCRYESIIKSNNLEHEKKRNKMMIELIKELDKQEDIHFKFYVINGHSRVGDLDLTMETIQKSNPKSFELCKYNSSTQQTWESIASCDFIISTRLHAAIFACFANVPFMLNEYHRKCTDFLDNVKFETTYRLHNSDFDIKDKAIQILSILNQESTINIPKIEEMKERALFNFVKTDIQSQ